MGSENLEVANLQLSDLLLQALIDKVRESHSATFALLAGRAGHLLFLYEAAKCRDSKIDLNWLSDEISALIAEAKAVLPDCSMAYGMAGIAWFYQYVLQDQQESDVENAAVDSLFSELLAVNNWQGEYEYVLGLAGYAPYLARRTHTEQGKKNAFALIQHFSKLAVIADGLAYWPTSAKSAFRMNKNSPEQAEVNLGLAHGNAGVLAALLTLSREPSVADAARPLLVAGCDWLLLQKQDVTMCRSYFSNLSHLQTKSRLGWCYGDLSIALTLGRAGKLLQQQQYIDSALVIALHAASRDAADAQIYDAGLCHGSSGLALIFKLLYRELKAPELLEAAIRWQNFYLQQYQQQGLSALHKWIGDVEPGDRRKREEDLGLLEGYAGIGLSLLTGLGQEPDWVDALLLA